MERREFTKTLASLPIVSVPSLPSTEFWEISSSWFQKPDHGELKLIKNGEVQHRWQYESYELWRKATLLNSRFVADSGNQATEYVADLFSMNIHEIYLDPPFFTVLFKDDSAKVRIWQGKYSDEEYRYRLEYHDEEGLHGTEGGANTIQEVVTEVAEFI